MRYFLIIASILFIALYTSGCQGDGKQSSAKQDEQEQQTAPAHQHDKQMSPVELNEGRRWEANKETNKGINRMKQLVSAFEHSDSLRAYRNLNARLMNEYQYILRECTMKGTAHEQLHNYLLPLKEQFERLQSEDIGRSRTAYQTIKTHLDKYSKYFK